MDTEKAITLFHWNILELDDELAIFVGLREKTNAPVASTKSQYLFRFSTPVKSFDEATGFGITVSGRIYRCVGKASDPHAEIRTIVSEMMAGRSFRYRYTFSSMQG